LSQELLIDLHIKLFYLVSETILATVHANCIQPDSWEG